MAARPSLRSMGRTRWSVNVVDPEVARFIELERGTPEQFRGLYFVTTESMRISAVCVSD
jgi:hypothetical protein